MLVSYSFLLVAYAGFFLEQAKLLEAPLKLYELISLLEAFKTKATISEAKISDASFSEANIQRLFWNSQLSTLKHKVQLIF